MKCPKCGSDKIQITNEIKSKNEEVLFGGYALVGGYFYL